MNLKFLTLGVISLLLGVIFFVAYSNKKATDPNTCHQSLFAAGASFLSMGILMMILSITGVSVHKALQNMAQGVATLSNYGATAAAPGPQPGFQPGYQTGYQPVQ